MESICAYSSSESDEDNCDKDETKLKFSTAVSLPSLNVEGIGRKRGLPEVQHEGIFPLQKQVIKRSTSERGTCIINIGGGGKRLLSEDCNERLSFGKNETCENKTENDSHSVNVGRTGMNYFAQERHEINFPLANQLQKNTKGNSKSLSQANLMKHSTNFTAENSALFQNATFSQKNSIQVGRSENNNPESKDIPKHETVECYNISNGHSSGCTETVVVAKKAATAGMKHVDLMHMPVGRNKINCSQSVEIPKNENIKRYISKRELKLIEERNLANKETNAALREDRFKLIAASDNVTTPQDNCTVNKPPKNILVQLEGHTKCANAVRWNKEHSFLLMSCGMDHTVKLWDVFNGRTSCIMNLTLHQQAVKDIRWTLGGRHGLSCGYDNTARLWDAEKGQELQQFQHKDFVTSLLVHPTDHNTFLTGTFKSGILQWDIRNNQIISRFEASFGQVQDLAFINENEFISAAEVMRRNSTDKGIMVWDLKTTAILSNQIYQEAYTCTCLRVHPYESQFMAQSNGNYIAIFSTKRPYRLNKYKRFEGHMVSGYHIGFDVSPDGSLVGSGSSDGSVHFYNYKTSKTISSLKSHTSVCSDLAFHPSLPSTVASCDWDGSVVVWK